MPLNPDFFDRIFDLAGIDLSLVKDPSEILDLAHEVFYDVAIKYAEGGSTLTSKEERELANEVLERLVRELSRRYHGRMN